MEIGVGICQKFSTDTVKILVKSLSNSFFIVLYYIMTSFFYFFDDVASIPTQLLCLRTVLELASSSTLKMFVILLNNVIQDQMSEILYHLITENKIKIISIQYSTKTPSSCHSHQISLTLF